MNRTPVKNIGLPLFPEFVPLSLEHKALYEHAAYISNVEVSELNFAELFLWRQYFKPFISTLNSNICIKVEKAKEIFYCPPLGTERIPETILEILDSVKSAAGKFEMSCLSEKLAFETSALRAGLEPVTARDDADYLYLAKDLSELRGSKYDGKRNFIKRFEQNEDFEFFLLDDKAARGCLDLQEEWCIAKNCSGNELLQEENKAVTEVFLNFSKLSVVGCAIKTGGRIQAFSIAYKLNPSTAVILFEKANPEVKGIYQAINQYFAKELARNFTYINREQDHGVAGLRKAKLSYQPIRLVNKYRIEL